MQSLVVDSSSSLHVQKEHNWQYGNLHSYHMGHKVNVRIVGKGSHMIAVIVQQEVQLVINVENLGTSTAECRSSTRVKEVLF